MSAGDAIEPPAFPNGTSHRMWEANYCNRCWHDQGFRNGSDDVGCSLIGLGFAHEKVNEWVETDAYPDPVRGVHCTRFAPDDLQPIASIETLEEICPEEADCNHKREEL